MIYFLKHPVTALVLNTIIIIIGVVCLCRVPVMEYPEVHIPVLHIYTSYPNASPELVETTVTNILEDYLAAVSGIDTIASNSTPGQSNISIRFRAGIDIDKAMTQVREALLLARPRLPTMPTKGLDPIVEHNTEGEDMPFMLFSIESSSMNLPDITHYAYLNLKSALRSIPGVASIDIWGQPYMYQVLLDMKKMYTFGINADEVISAISHNTMPLPAGQIDDSIPVTLRIDTQKAEDYENIVIKSEPLVLLKQISNISLVVDEAKFRVRVNGKPGICLRIHKTSDANPLEVSNEIRLALDKLRKVIPQGVNINIILDQADFIRHSIKNIESTLVETVICVFFIVLIFLRNLRAILVPLITIPISIIGACIFLKVCGFSINILTLMAMVLAIGLVVDDAIVVLENIQRHIDDGMETLEAVKTGIVEIRFAVIAMTLTLTSVYIPLAFVQGIVGQLFVEFAVVLAGSVIISGIVALTLSPLMCKHLLKRIDTNKIGVNAISIKIESIIDKLKISYEHTLTKAILYSKTCLLIAGGIIAGIGILYMVLPKEMAPREDRNLVGIYIPSNKDINDTERKLCQINQALDNLAISNLIKERVAFIGKWGGNVIIPLASNSQRNISSQEIINSIDKSMKTIPSLEAYPWSWDSGLPGLDGSAFESSELSLIVLTTESYSNMLQDIEKAKKALMENKIFQNVRHDLKLDAIGYDMELDRSLMSKLGINAQQVAKTMEVFFSGDRSLSFQKDHIMYGISVEGDATRNIDELYITNPKGKNISLGAIGSLVKILRPTKLHHHNQMRAITIKASINTKIEEAMQQMLNTIGLEEYKKNWSGAAKLYFESKGEMWLLFTLAIVFIYAILAVQFENFLDPLIILVTVPLAAFGALFLSLICGQSINIYTQVGLITLIGLITKHGILIIEFANQASKQMPLVQAIIKSSVLRLRPILMTTLAMIFGAIPLALYGGSGYEARRAIGIVLIGGLSFGTFFTLFLFPSIYYVCQTWIKKYKRTTACI